MLLRLLQGGFNRWTHREKFGPLRMTPAEGEGSHCSATVSVPRTAHSVDFVLSDVPEGEGTYDNRGDLDYHLPVEGSEVRKHDRPMTFLPRQLPEATASTPGLRTRWTLCSAVRARTPVSGRQVMRRSRQSHRQKSRGLATAAVRAEIL